MTTMHPTIQHINKTHPKITEMLRDLFGIPVEELLVRFEMWDTQKTLDAVNGNKITAKIISGLNDEPAEVKRIQKCVDEIQQNNSWLHPIILLEPKTIPWPTLNSKVPILKCPFDGDYFMLDGGHRCRALSNLLSNDNEFWKSKIHKIAIAYM